MSGIGMIIDFFMIIGGLVALTGVGIIVAFASQGRPIRGGILLAAVGVAIFMLLLFIGQGIVIVKPGQVAVVYNTFSGILESPPRQAGTHLIIPGLESAVIYDVTQKEYTMSATTEEGARRGDDSIAARTSDGQNVTLDVTVIFNVDPMRADILYPRWGASEENYLNGMVRPTIRTVIRDMVAEITAEDLYSAGRTAVQVEAEGRARTAFEVEGLQLTNLLIRRVEFSEEFSGAIEAKQTEEQRLERSRIEAQRLEVEAGGRAAAMRAEARGRADAVAIDAVAQAEALRLISTQLAANPLLLQYEYVQNLSDNVSLMLVPTNSPFLFDFAGLANLPGANPDFVAPEVPESTLVPSEEDTGTGN